MDYNESDQSTSNSALQQGLYHWSQLNYDEFYLLGCGRCKEEFFVDRESALFNSRSEITARMRGIVGIKAGEGIEGGE